MPKQKMALLGFVKEYEPGLTTILAYEGVFMIINKQMSIFQPTSNNHLDFKLDKGFVGQDEEDQESLAPANKWHIGQWWRKWLRLA